LLLHETGGDESDLLPIGRALVPGAALLSPRLDSLPVEDLAEWIGAAARKYALDPAKIYALGYSSGADLAIAAMLLRPDLIAGGLLLRPTKVVMPNAVSGLNAAPVLIVAGKSDEIISAAEAETLARQLTEAGAAVDFAIQDDAGHDLTPQDFLAGKKWFGQLLATSA
jgi:phospholipase/carboxylesterase